MSADDKCPPWIRLSTSHVVSQEGRYILGGKTAREWADYGRYCALLQLAARTEDGWIDVSNQRRLASLASDLAMTPKACTSWLAVLVEGGAIDRESYEAAGHVFIADVYNAVQGYKLKCGINRKNGRAGGRPKTET